MAVFEATEPAAPPLAGAERCHSLCPRARARAGRPGQTSHPGAPSLRSTRGAGHTHAAWAGKASPAATTAVPLNPPPLTWPGNAHNLRRETARRSNHTSRQSQPHTPSQQAVFLLFWILKRFAGLGWLLRPNMTAHWSQMRVSDQASVFSTAVPSGEQHPLSPTLPGSTA